MEKRGWWEWGGVGALVVVLLLSLFPAVEFARAERRDGIRRSELRAFKQLMEERNNELGYYPLDVNVAPYELVVVERVGKEARGWYLRAWLENTPAPAAGFDEEYNVYYRIGRDGERAYYDICGGEERCEAE